MEIFDNSLKQFVAHLIEEFRTLVAKEFDLAKTEILDKVSAMLKSGIALAVGGGLIFAGVLVLLAGAVAGLAKVVPLWLSAVLIGGFIALCGAIVAVAALANLKRIKMEPERTLASLREDKRRIKEEIKELKQSQARQDSGPAG
jgi:hypothetical protein